MTENVDAISSDQFFNDIMQGFEEASQYARGQLDLRVTQVQVVETSPNTTIVRAGSAMLTNSSPHRASTTAAKIRGKKES